MVNYIRYINDALCINSCFVCFVNDEVKYNLLVKKNTQQLINENTLHLIDYVENKSYYVTFPDTKIYYIKTFFGNSYYDSTTMDLHECCEKYADDIIENELRFDSHVKKVSDYFHLIDDQQANINRLKDYVDETVLHTMEAFGIKDLSAYLDKTPEILQQIKNRGWHLLLQQYDNAVEKLKAESVNFQKAGDLDSVEEIDIIIEMLNDAVKNDTLFDSAKDVADIYKLWPPILLPGPFVKGHEQPR